MNEKHIELLASLALIGLLSTSMGLCFAVNGITLSSERWESFDNGTSAIYWTHENIKLPEKYIKPLFNAHLVSLLVLFGADLTLQELREETERIRAEADQLERRVYQ